MYKVVDSGCSILHSMRFPQTFVAVEEARALQEMVEKTISKSILSRKLSDGQETHRQGGRRLSDGQKTHREGRRRLSEEEILAMSDHLSDSSPRVFSRLNELARSVGMNVEISRQFLL